MSRKKIIKGEVTESLTLTNDGLHQNICNFIFEDFSMRDSGVVIMFLFGNITDEHVKLICDYLGEKYEFKTISAETNMKKSAGKMFGFSLDQLFTDKKNIKDPVLGFTPKQIVFHFENQMRKLISENIWYFSVLRYIEKYSQKYKRWIVPVHPSSEGYFREVVDNNKDNTICIKFFNPEKDIGKDFMDKYIDYDMVLDNTESADTLFKQFDDLLTRKKIVSKKKRITTYGIVKQGCIIGIVIYFVLAFMRIIVSRK